MKRIWPLFAVLALLCALTIPALAAAGFLFLDSHP